MKLTPIEWTDYSANPLKFRDESGKIVWACVHASPGCQHCYAESLAKRYGRGGPFTAPTTAKVTPYLDEKEMRAMVRCKEASGKMCFPFDMTDLFGEWVPDALLDQVFTNVLELRRDVTWQILTKRAVRAKQYLTWRWKDRLVPRHIWIGGSVEDQKRADERIPQLLQTPAAVRFISAEPLLGPIDLTQIQIPNSGRGEEYDPIITMDTLGRPAAFGPHLDWVIVGGESGHGARPFDLAWARSIVVQCKSARVPVFVKQLGSVPMMEFAPQCDQLLTLKDRKGGNPAEWPVGDWPREFPKVAA